ncbi:MAG TPA: glycosyltransferase family 2 protein [Desulfobacteraceae bacterium]|nr:glycosyltransferase family 2 protein [Desulfobacteraceae bacterium]HPJ67670.1 glycosyltransferase family 2 protein [Desulfobacteraceae bacterium]HPQ27802.1 glycosyltransferase family 2 protein [Desulfobacteraceae bacterium]
MSTQSPKIIEFLIPCFNEEGNIETLIFEIQKVLPHTHYEYKFIFIDDGSSDKTFKVITNLTQKYNNISCVRLSRNFGKEAAIAVGLDRSRGDAIIILDADLQHPPHLIPSMLSEWEKGASIVDAVKASGHEGNILKRLTRYLFNRLFSNITRMDFEGASDYKLLDKHAVEILRGLDEKNRFFRGLTNWIGMEHSKIEFKVERRHLGETKWNWFKLFQLSVDAITSYSSKPLHIVTFLGVVSLIFSIILGIQTLYNKWFGDAVSGFTTVILVVLIMSSIVMISMGVLGIYLSKIYDEVKNRPISIVKEEISSSKKTQDQSPV